MAQRQESSVMVSLQEILLDARQQEERARAEAAERAREEAERRAAEEHRRRQDEAMRVRAEQERERQRALEEERRRAEGAAMRQAAVQRACLEAEANARLAKMAAQQEHERRLFALRHDKHKRRLTAALVGLGVVIMVGGAVAGVAIHRNLGAAAAARAYAGDLQRQVEQSEARQTALQKELDEARKSADPRRIEELKQRIAQENAREQRLGGPSRSSSATKAVAGPSRHASATPSGERSETCAPGDPLCSTL